MSVVTSKPSARASAAVASDAAVPHTVRPAFSAARSSDPPISPAPITHTARSVTDRKLRATPAVVAATRT